MIGCRGCLSFYTSRASYKSLASDNERWRESVTAPSDITKRAVISQGFEQMDERLTAPWSAITEQDLIKASAVLIIL